MIKLIEIVLSLFVIVQGLPDVKISFDRLQELSDEVNAKQTTWIAGNNFNDNHKNYLDLSHTVGVILKRDPNPKNSDGTYAHSNCKKNRGLPKNFDAREHWKECSATLKHVYDQGNCGGCWAVSVVSAFTDRLCIKSKGKEVDLRSTQQLLSCSQGKGCNGGWPLDAWRYLVREGETTGGDYNSKEGCQPYLIAPCAHHVNNTGLEWCSDRDIVKTPKCNHRCYNRNYKFSYNEDRAKAVSAYEIDPCSAQREIFEKGPIVAAFAVFEDFLTYKSGIYKHISGKLVGHHAVRVVGWGVQKDVPYWLVVNSWNRSWGDNGTFKVLRGSDEVMFEEYFTAGDV